MDSIVIFLALLPTFFLWFSFFLQTKRDLFSVYWIAESTFIDYTIRTLNRIRKAIKWTVDTQGVFRYWHKEITLQRQSFCYFLLIFVFSSFLLDFDCDLKYWTMNGYWTFGYLEQIKWKSNIKHKRQISHAVSFHKSVRKGIIS